VNGDSFLIYIKSQTLSDQRTESHGAIKVSRVANSMQPGFFLSNQKSMIFNIVNNHMNESPIKRRKWKSEPISGCSRLAADSTEKDRDEVLGAQSGY